jgi:hypothetical protein
MRWLKDIVIRRYTKYFLKLLEKLASEIEVESNFDFELRNE